MGETVDRFSLSENGTGSQDHLQHVEHGYILPGAETITHVIIQGF